MLLSLILVVHQVVVVVVVMSHTHPQMRQGDCPGKEGNLTIMELINLII